MRRAEKITFPGAGGASLSGRLLRPLGAVRGVALFAHCFTCGKDLRAVRRISEALSDRGFATLRFDFTGLGESQGDFADTTFSSNVDDLVAAADWLRSGVGAPSLLVGHSLGGAAVYLAAKRIPECRAVASIAAPADPEHVTHLFGDELDSIAEGEAEVRLAGRSFRIKRAFLEDLKETSLLRGLRDLKRAVLILHSPQDTLVGVDNARKLFQAAWHPKSFVSLDGADHLLGKPADATYVGQVIAAWADRYALDRSAGTRPTHDDDVEVVIGEEGFATEILVKGTHHLHADEPVSVGGTDTGPTPYDLLAAALGACTSMTLRMYADRKKWPLLGVRTHVHHGKVHADDCAELPDANPGKKVDRFRRVIDLVGPLDADQQARLMEIADRCPVHRTLEGQVVIKTERGRVSETD